MMKTIRILVLTLALALTAAPGLNAQEEPATELDVLHLNTIGAFSAGFVLQCYGYIGALADLLSKGVYEPDLVRSMLSETANYLRNVNAHLARYSGGEPALAGGDRRFIANMSDILNLLIAEAEALSSFAQTRSKEDVDRFEKARAEAWKNIKRTFGMS